MIRNEKLIETENEKHIKAREDFGLRLMSRIDVLLTGLTGCPVQWSVDDLGEPCILVAGDPQLHVLEAMQRKLGVRVRRTEPPPKKRTR